MQGGDARRRHRDEDDVESLDFDLRQAAAERVLGTSALRSRWVGMSRRRAEALLNRINATLTDCNNQIRETRRRLAKAESRDTATVLQCEIEAMSVYVDTLKGQQKALKRGIVPEDLAGKDDQ
jgi:hypothetical protein